MVEVGFTDSKKAWASNISSTLTFEKNRTSLHMAPKKRDFFVLDLASDHVHSRLVSGAIWMIIPAMLAQMFAPVSQQLRSALLET